MPRSFVIGVLIDMNSSVGYGTISTRWDPHRIDLFHQAFVAELSYESVVDKLGDERFGGLARDS
jgi:hypothetical protein